MDMGRKAIRILNKTEDKVIHADGCVEKAYNFLETGEDDLEDRKSTRLNSSHR